MKKYSLDSKEDFLEALNAANQTTFTLATLHIDAPEQRAIDVSTDIEPETNTLVRVSDATGEVTIGYRRQSPAAVFGSVSGLELNESREGEESVEVRALRRLCEGTNFPYDQSCMSGAIEDGKLVIGYRGHYVLDGTTSVPITVNPLVSIDTLMGVGTTDDFQSLYTAPSVDTSYACIVAEILKLNPKLDASKFTLSEPRASGDVRPTDSVIIKPANGDSPYTGSVEFTYSRVNIEERVKGSIDVGFFKSFTEFYNIVTPEYVAALLTTRLQIPFVASEIRVRDQKDTAGTFSARITVVDNYVVRSAGGIFITGGKDL